MHYSNSMVVTFIVGIFQGETSHPSLTTHSMERNYDSSSPLLKLLYDAIRCHIYFSSGDLEQASRAMGRALRVLDDVHYMEGRVWYPIVLLIISLYSMLELSLKIHKPQSSRMGSLFRNPTRSGHVTNRTVENVSQDLSDTSTSTFELQPDSSTATYRAPNPAALAIIRSGSVMERVPTSTIPPAAVASYDRSVVRQWTVLLLQKLNDLTSYAFCDSLVVLSKTLYKILWDEAKLLSVPKVGSSHSHTLLEESKRIYLRRDMHINYVAVVMAVKAWRLAAPGQEAMECKDCVMKMIQEGRMESCMAIL